jgi:hypothetical protein
MLTTIAIHPVSISIAGQLVDSLAGASIYDPYIFLGTRAKACYPEHFSPIAQLPLIDRDVNTL